MSVAVAEGIDLLRLPVVGAFLRRSWARPLLQLPLLAAALVLVWHGLAGPSLAPKNLATVLTWVHYRGLLIAAILVFGNAFCMACPLLLPRDLARRLATPRWTFPRALRSKWLSLGLFAGVLFAYERFDLWGSPVWTAALMLGYFAAAFAVDALFQRASFCKFVCPVGQFSFVAATVSPFEVRARDLDTCAGCRTKDCLRGRRGADGEIQLRGCELDLYVPRKVGNLDCTFCLDCARACPHDNVALVSRIPGDELAVAGFRSGIGDPGGRADYAALFVLFCFGAVLNAFGMVSPVYEVQRWLGDVLGTRSEGVVLSAIFFAGLVVEPVALLGITGWAALRLTRSSGGVFPHVKRFAAVLVPVGLSVWAAHYGFHLLTGIWTAVPVAQSAARAAGLDLGAPDWGRGGLPAFAVRPIELGLLLLGLAGSLSVAWQLARRDFAERSLGAFVPWAVLIAALFASAVWLMEQPMELRGTFL